MWYLVTKECMAMVNRIPNKPFPSDGTLGTQPSPVPIPQFDLSMVHEWRREVENLIGKHPGAFLAASIGVGLVFGWWAKRK